MSQEFSAVPTPFTEAIGQNYLVGKSSSDSDYLLFEGDTVIRTFHTQEAADKDSKAFSFLADLRFLLQALDDPDAILLNTADTDLAVAEVGGGRILTDEMVLREHQYAVHDILDDCTDSGLRADIYRAIDHLSEVPGVRGSECLLFTTMLSGDSGFGHESAVGNYLCHFRFGADAQDLQSMHVRQLNNHYELDRGGRTLMNCLYEVIQSPEHSVIIDSMEELPDWVDVIKRMPCLQQALPRISPDFRGYISESGPVLRQLADRKPWLVETDNDGVPVPMRVVRVQAFETVSEDGLRRDNQAIAAAFFKDSLEEHARERQKSARGELHRGSSRGEATLGKKSGPESFFKTDASDSTLGR